MTLPDERYRAVIWAERFLRELSQDTKKYPRVPKAVRKEAYSILRHFPSQWDMDRASNGAPDIFQPRMEDLHRFLLKGKEMRNGTTTE